ncbi:MAG: ABC transporter permease [Gracilibacteraceae bacterium]|jgi:ABC-2 type transport system permease protein|nr:ABC transporter permease [Gracilibacteraceae bacterium]
MRTAALAARILKQMRRDRRTLALMLFAPLIVLSLMYIVLAGDEQPARLAVFNLPADYIENLSRSNAQPVRMDEAAAMAALREGDVAAVLTVRSGKLYIYADGASPGKAGKALSLAESAWAYAQPAAPGGANTEVVYVYGYADMSLFDNCGPVLIGFLVFFFVFLVSGISFLQERTTGTLEKLLSTPIRRAEIVGGYLLGFGLLTSLQSALIVFFCVYVLGVVMVGSFGTVVLVTLSGALTALTFGLLLSTAAQSEFQMMQFIPLVIVPQVFFSGLFDLSPQLELIGRFTPLYYVADALRAVMHKGAGPAEILPSLCVMYGLALLFALANIRLLRKHRAL